MQRILSFDQAPSLSAPLRFFLSAPLFAIVAAALLLWEGPLALSSRWSPFTLALTHLFTLGFLTSSMIGALIHILPVAAGIALPRTALTATVVHALLSTGAVLLAAAFWLSQTLLFELALLFLLPAFIWFLAAGVIGLWRAPASGARATVAAVRLALAALAVTIVLGATLGSAFAWPSQFSFPLARLTDLHALWGLFGWVGLLIVGVAYQVVPMFQVTAIYPRHLTRSLALSLFVLLMLFTLADALLQGQFSWIPTLLSTLILLGFSWFAATTLYLLAHRKRPKPDATTLFWRTAMASLLAGAALWIIEKTTGSISHPLTLGVLFIVGFAYSTINGMLYKIVPFLVWYHLQTTLPGGCRSVPSVKQILPDELAKKQFWLHLAALLLLLAATLWPAALARPAALVLCASSIWLWINVFKATRIYWRLQASATPAHA